MGLPAGSVDAWRRREEDAPAVDPRIRKAVVFAFSRYVGAAGVVWGVIYLALGVPGASLYPFGFTVATMINVLAHRRHRRFEPFAAVELALIALVPAGVMLHLGGFTSSGGVGLWSLLAPIGALLSLGPTVAAVGVFVTFVAFTGVGIWANEAFPPIETLPSSAVDWFLFLNLLAVSVVAFWVMRMFLVANDTLRREQVRLRRIEQNYVAQEAMMRQTERLATLGKLSAGVAHELNNPAAAVSRATSHLGEVVSRLIDDAVGLLRFGVGADGLSWVSDMARAVDDTDPIEASDREDRLGRWLESRGAEDAWELASALADLGFDADSLQAASERYNEGQVLGAIRWISDVARADRLISEMRTSTGRISQIVEALKGYSHMDSASDVDFDVRAGIEDTLVILRTKLSGIEVRRQFSEHLPAINGNPGELNQVWTNLVANAAEALDGSGTITISTGIDGNEVRVVVEDDGPGVRGDIVDSIFDPFVTTKAPGEGTGLGLNLSHQIVVDRHGGSIEVESEPGRTRFVVVLPVADGVSKS